MASLTDIHLSNARIASALPSGLVAVFVGATSGIGEASLKALAKHARRPRIYFVGRSQEAGDRIIAECKAFKTEGEFIFIQADTSLIRNVDDVCRDIKSKEKAIHLLFLSTGTLTLYTKTAEGLNLAVSLVHYSRNRFIVNLLPLIQNANALRRVVSVFTAGKEGPIDASDFQGWKVPMMSQRGQMSSMVTLSLEAIAKQAPNVAFIHNYPGSVKTNLARGNSVAMILLKVFFTVIGPLTYMSNDECGERHIFLATSARYPPGTGDTGSGVPLSAVAVARGTNGEAGSGVYSVGAYGESSGRKVEAFLAKLREEGMVEKVWNHTEEEFKRITETTVP